MNLDDEDPVVIAHLILWLYKADYLLGSGGEEDEPEETRLNAEMILKAGKQSLFTDAADDEWTVPEALHAKMYLAGERYGIDALKELAIDELRNELSWTHATAFLPSLEHLFAPAHADKVVQNKTLWDLLAGTASKEFLGYQHEERFEAVLTANPTLMWDVLQRVGARLGAAEDQCKELNASIDVLKPRKKKQKKNQSPSS